jgi:hypothetical protein
MWMKGKKDDCNKEAGKNFFLQVHSHNGTTK